MKWILSSIVIASFLLFLPVPVHATYCPSGFDTLCNISVGDKSGGIVGAIVQFLLVIAIIVSLFFLLFGGFRWVTSGGDKNKIAQARSTIIAAIVGLIIALLAFFIINVVLIFFTGKGLSSLSMPKLVK